LLCFIRINNAPRRKIYISAIRTVFFCLYFRHSFMRFSPDFFATAQCRIDGLLVRMAFLPSVPPLPFRPSSSFVITRRVLTPESATTEVYYDSRLSEFHEPGLIRSCFFVLCTLSALISYNTLLLHNDSFRVATLFHAYYLSLIQGTHLWDALRPGNIFIAMFLSL